MSEFMRRIEAARIAAEAKAQADASRAAAEQERLRQANARAEAETAARVRSLMENARRVDEAKEAEVQRAKEIAKGILDKLAKESPDIRKDSRGDKPHIFESGVRKGRDSYEALDLSWGKLEPTRREARLLRSRTGLFGPDRITERDSTSIGVSIYDGSVVVKGQNKVGSVPLDEFLSNPDSIIPHLGAALADPLQSSWDLSRKNIRRSRKEKPDDNWARGGGMG